MRRAGVVAGGVIVMLVATASLARPEVIDRILAVVNGQAITLSDARAALRFELLPPEVSTDPVEGMLQRLIDRRVMLTEVDRYAPPEPPPEAVGAALASIRGRFKDALEFETVVTRYGLSQEELRRFLRDSLRIDAYLQQRFGAVAEPAEEDLVKHYQAHQADFTTGEGLRPFGEVREAVRARVVERQRAEFLREWVTGLRRRASIQVLYLPERRSQRAGDYRPGTTTRR